MKTNRLIALGCLILGLLSAPQAFAQPRYRGGNGPGGDVSLDDAVRSVRGRDRQVMSARTVDRDGRRVHVIRTLTPDGRVRRFQMDAGPDGPRSYDRRDR